MPYFAVRSQNILACVVADDHLSAAVNAYNLRIQEHERDPDHVPPVGIGHLVAVAEQGATALEARLFRPEVVIEAGGFCRLGASRN